MPKIHCSFIQGTKKNHMNGPVYTTTKSLNMDGEMPKQGQIRFHSMDPNQNQWLNKEEDSNDK